MLGLFNNVQLFATLWTLACQAPLSMGFSRQEYWSKLLCPPPGDLPNPGIIIKLKNYKNKISHKSSTFKKKWEDQTTLGSHSNSMTLGWSCPHWDKRSPPAQAVHTEPIYLVSLEGVCNNYFYFSLAMQGFPGGSAYEISVPWLGMEPRPRPWEQWILITGNSLALFYRCEFTLPSHSIPWRMDGKYSC